MYKKDFSTIFMPQMPIFSALGAECTVLDYSQKQLESERAFAEQEGRAVLFMTPFIKEEEYE